MKKIISIMLALLVAITAGSALAADKCGSVKDVETFIQFNMPDKAMDCLDNLISTNPGDTRLHFLKGKYCLQAGNYDCAKDRFNVSPVKQGHAADIARAYRAEGERKLSSDMKIAVELLQQAAMYQSGLASQMAEDYFRKGKETGAKQYFDLAVRFNPSMGERIADFYADKSKTASDDNQKIAYLGEAVKYDNSKRYEGGYINAKEKKGLYYLNLAKEMAKIPGKEKLTEEYKREAREAFAGTSKEGMVEQELPEVLVLRPREQEYKFALKKGERTPYWLWWEQGIITNFQFSHTNGNYEMHLQDGEVVRVWAGEKMPQKTNEKFVIVATDDTKVYIKVTK